MRVRPFGLPALVVGPLGTALVTNFPEVPPSVFMLASGSRVIPRRHLAIQVESGHGVAFAHSSSAVKAGDAHHSTSTTTG